MPGRSEIEDTILFQPPFNCDPELFQGSIAQTLLPWVLKLTRPVGKNKIFQGNVPWTSCVRHSRIEKVEERAFASIFGYDSIDVCPTCVIIYILLSVQSGRVSPVGNHGEVYHETRSGLWTRAKNNDNIFLLGDRNLMYGTDGFIVP